MCDLNFWNIFSIFTNLIDGTTIFKASSQVVKTIAYIIIIVYLYGCILYIFIFNGWFSRDKFLVLDLTWEVYN